MGNISASDWVATGIPGSLISLVSVARFLVAFAAALCLYILITGLFFNRTRNIPGPLLARFTTVYFFHRILRGSLGSDVVELHRKYGPIVRLGPNYVDVQSHEIAENAWAGHNDSRRPWHKDPMVGELVRFGLKADNLVSLPGPREALRMRRLIGPPFSRKFVLEQEYIFKDCARRFVASLERLCAEREAGVDILLEFRKYTLDVVTQFSYGGYFKVSPSSVIAINDDVIAANTIYGLFPTVFKVLKHIPLRILHWTHAQEEIYKVSPKPCVRADYLMGDLSVNEYKRHVKPGSRKDSLSQLIAARDENGVPLSHEELIAAGLIFMIVGGDSTATALMFISYRLAKDHNLIGNLAKELSSYNSVDDLSLNELEKLPLLNAVILESLRLYPPAPFPTGRICPPQGITLEKYFIPAGVNVMHNVFAICRDPVQFPDPEEFKPKRWMELSREAQNKLFDRSMIFGYGPRVCLGKEHVFFVDETDLRMAMMEIRMAVSALVLNYESWTGVSDSPGCWDEEMKPYESIVLTPKKKKCVLKFKARV